jgi:hypothetical protein
VTGQGSRAEGRALSGRQPFSGSVRRVPRAGGTSAADASRQRSVDTSRAADAGVVRHRLTAARQRSCAPGTAGDSALGPGAYSAGGWPLVAITARLAKAARREAYVEVDRRPAADPRADPPRQGGGAGRQRRPAAEGNPAAGCAVRPAGRCGLTCCTTAGPSTTPP